MKYHLLMSNLVYIDELRLKFRDLYFCYFLQRGPSGGYKTKPSALALTVTDRFIILN